MVKRLSNIKTLHNTTLLMSTTVLVLMLLIRYCNRCCNNYYYCIFFFLQIGIFSIHSTIKYTFGNVIDSVRSFRSLELILFNARRHYSQQTMRRTKTNRNEIDTRKKKTKIIKTGLSRDNLKKIHNKKEINTPRHEVWISTCIMLCYSRSVYIMPYCIYNV